jgi:hypothetical protein
MTPPLYRQSWLVVAGGLAAIAVLGAVIGGVGSEPDSVVSTASSSASTAAPTTPAPTVSVPPTSVPTRPAPTTSAPAASATGVDFAMPDVVGMDLQSAQDLIQTHGVFLSVSHDLRGSRHQVLDSNWLVCDQNIPPGEQVSGDAEGKIDLGVVKREESCP